MKNPRFLHVSRLAASTLLLPSLFMFAAASSAEPPPAPESQAPIEPTAVALQAAELKVYKQSFEVTANVACRVPKKGASYCTTDIGSEIEYQIEPELVLRYTSIRLDEQEFATEITPQGSLRFRTDKVNYSGPQVFVVELIYLK